LRRQRSYPADGTAVRRARVALACSLALAVLLPTAALAAPARPGPGPNVAPAVTERSTFRLDLGEPGDDVQQTNFVQCVGASMQMMLDMIRPGAYRSARTQVELQDLARHWSGPRPDGTTREGASVRGWAAGLTIRGGGGYMPRPGASLTPEAIGRQFVARGFGGRWSQVNPTSRLGGKYVLVLPFDPLPASDGSPRLL
jgi:hypothetical protein